MFERSTQTVLLNIVLLSPSIYTVNVILFANFWCFGYEWKQAYSNFQYASSKLCNKHPLNFVFELMFRLLEVV